LTEQTSKISNGSIGGMNGMEAGLMTSKGTTLKFDHDKFSLIIDEDERVAYAYLLRNGRIVGDVWLFNKIEADQFPEWKTKLNEPPFLNPPQFCGAIPFGVPVVMDRYAVNWEVSANAPTRADVLIDGVLVARIEDGSKPGWSTLVSKDGPLAKRLL
jgi:hypothetical protein